METEKPSDTQIFFLFFGVYTLFKASLHNRLLCVMDVFRKE